MTIPSCCFWSSTTAAWEATLSCEKRMVLPLSRSESRSRTERMMSSIIITVFTEAKVLSSCCMAEKKQVIEVHFDRREKIHSKSRLTLFAVLFLVSLLAVLHVISSHTALGITVALMLLCARDVLKKVDYWLLATFVCFFIFAGNIGEIGAVKRFLEGALQQNTMLGAVLSSQIISNVPAAVLLSNFTTDAKGMLLGTNIGGLGTLVASLASLISFKQYIRTPGAKPLHRHP